MASSRSNSSSSWLTKRSALQMLKVSPRPTKTSFFSRPTALTIRLSNLIRPCLSHPNWLALPKSLRMILWPRVSLSGMLLIFLRNSLILAGGQTDTYPSGCAQAIYTSASSPRNRHFAGIVTRFLASRLCRYSPTYKGSWFISSIVQPTYLRHFMLFHDITSHPVK